MRNPAASLPAINLPKGGGAIRGIGEKFTANPVTGTGSMTVPIAISPGRSGFGPQLSLSYDSGAGNGPFGLGWNLAIPAITRKTDKGVPQYRDAEESDVFLFSGTEDLVPAPQLDGTPFAEHGGYRIHRYRPRIEGLFARIERWTELASGETHWRSISPANATTIYGKSAESRISDAGNPTHVFSWVICETYDDKGNAAVYEYVAETRDNVDETQAHERNRARVTLPAANRYLKRIKYGNRVSRLIQPDLAAVEWLFQVVFDYGDDHYETLPDVGNEHFIRAAADPAGTWPVRSDPFSIYRPGFEVRAYRRCRRVLMFHQFDELGDEPCLVRSTEFHYADLDYALSPGVEAELAHEGSTRFVSCIRAVTQSGYVRDKTAATVARGGVKFLTYQKKSLPPVQFEYSQARVQADVEVVPPESVENLPAGLDETNCQWVDLDGEGLSGILTEQNGAWYYKRNVSPAPVTGPANGARVHFGPMEPVAKIPSLANLSGGQQFMDLAGDGQMDVVDLAPETAGFFERTPEGSWESFRAFGSYPNISWQDPNVRFVDLTGDGLPDVLITEDNVLTWHCSRAEEGFGAAEKTASPVDEEKGPRVLFADGTQSTYLADMSGSGLTDIVRVRNGEICYWPSLGYGRFGAKVTMDNAPWFDAPEQFDQRRVRLADIKGSGVIDLIYIRRDGVQLYFNQSGNRWSDASPLKVFPRVDDLSDITVADLLGNGTACLVWSSLLPGERHAPMRYVRLMEEKPHLLTKVVNNLGAETRIHYTTSTRFYLEDKAAGKPWITRLPFPVHVVERVESIDYISRRRFASRYAYHHGFYDGTEREFRGFAMVEQWDTEAYEDYVVGVARIEGGQELAPELNQPPVLTRTWFHTGAYLDRRKLLHQLSDEYYQKQTYLPEPVLPGDVDADELHECARALKGLPLRSETYSFDGSPKEQHPYLVTESSCEIRWLQRHGERRHAVLLPLHRESVSFYYERDTADPRINHTLNLDFDPFGNVRKSASVVYGRKIVAGALPAKVTEAQQRLYVTYRETDFTDAIDNPQPDPAYRLPASHGVRTYEITGVNPAAKLFTADDIAGKIAGAGPIDYEIVASGPASKKRLLGQSRVLFLDNALNPLPLGEWDTLGLPSQSFQLAFTPGVVAAHYAGKVTPAEFGAAGYVHFDGDDNWWIPSGTAVFPANTAAHFYIPRGGQDPFGLETETTFDVYDLLPERARIKQAAWTEVVVANDYRVLGAAMVTDPNKNRSAVEFDALGMVVKSAVMGKLGSTDGDTLADPTTRMEYALFNWVNNRKPNYVHTFAREKHGAANPRWQESYVYSNGSGGVAMVKAQAHPGKALKVNPNGTKVEVDADPRWVGNGRTIVNNKGNPVKQYEAYFSTTHEYEEEKELREIGATPVLYYDALGRNVRTLFPNGTFAKVEFNSWTEKVFDANDTVKASQWYIAQGSPDPATQPEPLNNPERRAAWLAAKHADTPGTVHFDSLGRPVYAISDYGGGKRGAVRSESDLTGRLSKLFDQTQREVASGFVGMAGAPILAESAEKGRRWTFQNVLGALVKTWDEHGRQFRAKYDILHRLLSTFVQEAGAGEILFNYIVYGDRLANAEQLNMFGTAHQIFDQAGMVRVPALDFKGNPKLVERLLAKDYKNNLDWTALAAQPDYAAIQTTSNPALEIGEVFTASSQYDALNRPTQVLLPDSTLILPTYNEANFLASLQVKIRGQGNFIQFLKDQDYDAKGQRQFAHFGNDVFTRYFYDPKTFRLTQLLTYKSGDDPDLDALQDLHYVYDPSGNITQIWDEAQQTHYFANAVAPPEWRYEYDAIYQLVRATGREHASLTNDTNRDHRDLDFVRQLPHVNDATAVRPFTEHYEYDLLGNILKMRHVTTAGPGSWTRNYRYAYQDDAANRTNQLKSSNAPGDPDAGPYTATYDHDPYGNMIRMPHLTEMVWNFMDQLRRVDLGGGGTTFYVYGTGGQRIRKVVERLGARRVERVYLGSVEIYRERNGNNQPDLVRETLHISDNAGCIAQVDTKTRDDNNTDTANPLNVSLIRYQYGNHFGSAILETNENADPISYEEYHPYGTSAYRCAKPGTDLSLKRYRFSGKERDDETGLDYFGARYYASWLGRWTSSDPAGYVGGLNLFRYCSNNPVMFHDPNGMDDVPVRSRELGPKASWQTIQQSVPEGYRIRPGINEQNYRSHWSNRDRGYWNILERIPQVSSDPPNAPASSDTTPSSGPPENPPPASSPQSGPDAGQGNDRSSETTFGPASSQSGDNSSSTLERVLPYVSNELSNAGLIRALDTAKKAGLGTVVQTLLKNQTILDNVQRISRAASNARQALRAADQAAGGVLNRIVSRVLDTNSSKSWGDFVNKALGGRRGEQALEEAYRTVARNSAVGNRVANGLGIAGRVLGGALGGVGMVLSGYSLYQNLSRGHWFEGFVDSTSFVASGLAFGGAIAGSAALTEAGLVIGAFGVGVLIGTGLDKGAEWASKKLFGVDLSPSNLIASALTAGDRALTSLWSDPSKPAYTQSLGWKLANALGL